MKKIIDTLNFYYQKVVKVLNVTLDSIVKIIETTLNKIPVLIEDIYAIIKVNITAQNALLFVLAYIIYENFGALTKVPLLLVSMLVAIVMPADKLKLK